MEDLDLFKEIEFVKSIRCMGMEISLNVKEIIEKAY